MGFEAHDTSTVSVLSCSKEDLYGRSLSHKEFHHFSQHIFSKNLNYTTFFNSAHGKDTYIIPAKWKKTDIIQRWGGSCV